MTVNEAAADSGLSDSVPSPYTDADASLSRVKQLLAHDSKVKVAGIDADGILRGKIMNKEKFLGSIKSGFGMSSAIFSWDMHDVLYAEESSLTSANQSYEDFTALIDLDSFRRLPFENDIAFFLLRFSVLEKPVEADGRGMTKSVTDSMASKGFRGLAGGKCGHRLNLEEALPS
jgi:glutamine synthetase